MMVNIILIVFIITYFHLILLASIAWHEMGHMTILKEHTGRAIKMNFKKKGRGLYKLYSETQADYNILTDKQYLEVTIVGVLFGLIPIIFAIGMTTLNVPVWLLVLPYIYGCVPDIKEVVKFSNV